MVRPRTKPPTLLCLNICPVLHGGFPHLCCDRELGHEGKHYDTNFDQEWE